MSSGPAVDAAAVQPKSHGDHPVQGVFALVNGEPFIDMPQDLFIPPDALEVFLEAFEGPLDLLLYLIRRQNLEILEIPIAEITKQYMVYVELMQNVRLELAGEYLVMAATLAEIKSRMLLPRSSELDEDDESDPRAELIRRLQEYERFKKAAEDIEEMPRMERDLTQAGAELVERVVNAEPPDVDLRELMLAFASVLKRVDLNTSHHISTEKLSVRERMTGVLDRLSSHGFVTLSDLFTIEEGRAGVVVSFLAILELVKEKLVVLVQAEDYGEIHVRLREELAPE